MRATMLLLVIAASALGVAGVVDGDEAPMPFQPSGESFDGLDSRLGYPDASTRHLHRLATAPRSVENSALPPRHLDDARHPESLVARELIVSGGPSPDAIPALEDPVVEPVRSVDWLEDDEAVLSVEVDDEARAYPVQIMLWHEIANDELAGRPVSVTYCPICNSAVAFDRDLDGRHLDFGTSGALYLGALVMYDRQTESLWTHFDGRAVVGTLVGAQLRLVPVATVSWADFRRDHPDGTVLSRETGYRRDYGDNPYARFHGELATPPFTYGDVDPRAEPLAAVVGLRGTRERIAIAADRLEEVGVVTLELDGRPVAVWHRPGLAFPVGAATVAAGAEVGATPAFYVDELGDDVRFAPVDGGFRDLSTGTVWNVSGRGVAGQLEGVRLEAVSVVTTRWFAWSGYHPDTSLHEPASAGSGH